jgi:Carboxypeptidase regulatory-like domain
MMTHLSWRAGPLVLFSLLVFSSVPSLAGAQAQATTGIIRGVISDATGAPVAAATVTLRNQQTNFSRVLQTSARGIFVGTLLPLGTYEVSVRAIGWAPASRANLVVRLGEVISQSFTLTRQAVQLAAVQVAERANEPADAERTASAARVNEAAVRGLPNNGRNFLALTLLTPGVAVAQGPDGDVLSVSGQKGISNNVSVDGADYNNPFFGEQRGGQRPAFTFNLDAVQELVVTSQGANAEFGRSAGGFVNVITKSGTNELKGTVHYFGKSSKLSNDLRGNGVTLKPDFGQHQFGFTLGGPIVKDKLFFFTAYDQQTYGDTKQQTRPASPAFDSLRTFLTTQWGGALKNDFSAIDRSNDAQVFLGKLDWRVNTTNLLSVKYNFTNSKQVNGTFDVDTWGASANAIEKDFSNAVSGQLSTQLSNNMSNEFRFQLAREDRPRDYVAPKLPNGRDFPDIAMDFSNAFRIGRPFFIPVEYYDTRVQLLNNVTWTKGDHLFKAGAEINQVSSNQTFIGFANGRFIFNSVTGFINYAKNPSYVECSNRTSNTTGACPAGTTVTGPVLLYLQQAGVGGRTVEQSGTQQIPQTDMALFVQDSWKPTSRVTVDYGIRWEGEKQPGVLTDPSSVFFAPFIGKTVTNSKGTFEFPSNGRIPSDLAMFQPRFGLAWDVNGDGSEVLRFSAGQYNARVAALSFASVRNNNGSIGQTMYRDSPLTPILGPPPAIDALIPAPGANQVPFQPGVFVVDKNFKNPRTFSTSAAYERALGSMGLTGLVSYTFAKSDRLTRFVNRNDAVFGSPWATGLAGGNGIGTLTTVESSAESKYNGITLGLSRRQAGNWVFDANYTLSWDKSNDDNERDPFTFRYARADRLDDEWGYSDRDQRHRFNAFVLTKLGYDITMNNRFTYTSASPMSDKCGANNLPTGTRASGAGDRLCPNGTILERNTLRRQNEFASWDLRFARPVNIAGTTSAEVMFEVFNVLGRNNYRDPAFGSLLFNFDGTIRSGFGDPRQIQLGMRYSF